MKKKLTYKGVMGEVFALTGAVAIIAAAVYFFLVPSHTTVSSISGLGIILTNFIPLPLSVITMIHRIYYLRERIWYENGLYQYCIASVYRNIRENISEYRIADEQSGVGCAVLCISSQCRTQHSV